MRFFILSMAVFVVVTLPTIALGHNAFIDGIVPSESVCGGPGSPYFQAADLVHLVNHIIEFAVYLTAFIATVMFAYAGFLYVTAAANPDNINNAKRIFGKVLLGFVFVLTAWLIVDIILTVFTEKDFGFWTDIDCTEWSTLEDAVGSTVQTERGVQAATCANCEDVRAFNCNNPRSCQVPPDTNDQLDQFRASIESDGGNIGDYTITETGVNQTVTHRSGSANLDLGCRGSGRNADGTCTAEWVKSTASWGGSNAIYETNSQADYNAKVQAGIPENRLLLLGTFDSNGSCSNPSGCITAPHVSLNP